MLSSLLLTTLISSVVAFAPVQHQQHRVPFTNTITQRMSSSDDANYVITGNNLDLSPALSDYVNTKLDKVVGKLSNSGLIEGCSVHLTVNKNPSVKDCNKAEVVTSVKGTVIRCAEESPDMYASIDFVTDRLARKLVKYKERRLDGYHGGPNMGENLAEVLNELDESDESKLAQLDAVLEEEAEEYIDPEAPVVTKVKSYDLSKPISLEEAVFALGYVDHDFYVYRDAESNEISVVYKRNAGGYGLIQPQS
mmetsp:Transcript_19049/g.22752  ORF Transcript_19049/g.22752 Transcript_19049/m.22752 type:complete len:251 (-) Transcript_19049:333-1085(-)